MIPLISQHRRFSPIGRARRLILLTGLTAAVFAGCQTAPSVQSETAYPAIGKRLLVTFPAFRAELNIHSASSLTWFILTADGSKGRPD